MTNLDPSPELLFGHAAMRMKMCRRGPMLYNIHDTYVGRSFDLYGEYAEDEMGLLANFVRPGQAVMDIGANIGAHTIFFAKQVGPEGRVVAFEPQRQVFQTLCANVTLNGLNNVLTFHAGAADKTGMATIPVPDYAQDGNFGGISMLGAQNGEPVQVMMLDQVGFGGLSLIKIDVEGMELAVLMGAAKTIETHKPVLYLENDRPDNSQALLSHVLGLGYRVYWHISPLYNANNAFQNGENVFGGTVSLNVLCIHADRDQNIQGLKEVADPNEFPNIQG